MSCELYSYILCSCVGYIPHHPYLCLFIFKIHHNLPVYDPIANAIKNTIKTNTENTNNKHIIMSILFIIPCIL